MQPIFQFVKNMLFTVKFTPNKSRGPVILSYRIRTVSIAERIESFADLSQNC